MKTPHLWQKLKAGVKNAANKVFRPTPAPKPTDDDFFRESGESVYHKGKGVRALRKRKKCMENKSRAINYRQKKRA